MSNKHCDKCSCRVRPNHHALLLSDLLTGQRIGYYHAPQCLEAAVKYITNGAAIRASFMHPDSCGPQQEHCNAGLEMSA